MNFSSLSQTQFKNLDDLAGKLIRGLRSDPAENIFIHTDKSVYKVGETVWFNAYLINKVSHRISHQSRIVFVDLVNDRDSVIRQWVLDARSLRLDGNIQLPVVLQDGNYWLRGYTNNILQSDSSDICIYPIYVVNPQNTNPANSVTPIINPFLNQDPKFEFYPEGGSLIAGVHCVVAFRVTDQNNNPLEISGYIKDNRDSVTTRFETSLPGLGKFSIFPWKTRQYTAYIKTKMGQLFSYAIPSVNDYAACLSVVSENENSFKVRVSLGDSLYDKQTITYLLGISRDSLCFASVGERMYETDIPKKDFPQGEATVFLFDEHEQLVSERSIYIENNSPIVKIRPDKENYLPRQNAVLDVSVSSANDHPALSLLTVSVTDDSTVRYFYDGDVEAVMKTPYSAAEKDLMMLAQKNKYKKWSFSDSVLLVKDARADENFFNAHGTVFTKKNLPAPDIIVTLFSLRGQAVFKTDTTDEKGRFNFDLPGYADSTQFTLQATDKKGREADVTIALDSTLLPRINTPLYLKKSLPVSAIGEIIQKKGESQDFLLPGRGKELKEVIVKGRIKKRLDYDEQKRVSQFSRIITPDMLERASFGTLSNVLFMIPGAHVTNGKLIIDPGGDAEPLVVMDGVEVAINANPMVHTVNGSGKDTSIPGGSIEGPSPLINFLNSLSPAYIDFIEVLNGPEAAFYGVRGANGAIIINTRTSPHERNVSKQIVLRKFYPLEYNTSAPFAEPDYSKKEIRRNKLADVRSTIYWSGPVITDDNGKAVIHFFTADPVATYTVTVKGITVSGDIFFKRFSIARK